MSVLSKKFLPEFIIVAIHQEDELNLLSKLLFFTGKQFSQSETNVFVCKDFSCSLPLTNIEDVEENL